VPGLERRYIYLGAGHNGCFPRVAMVVPRHTLESSGDRCFACARSIADDDLAVYLYGTRHREFR